MKTVRRVPVSLSPADGWYVAIAILSEGGQPDVAYWPVMAWVITDNLIEENGKVETSRDVQALIGYEALTYAADNERFLSYLHEGDMVDVDLINTLVHVSMHYWEKAAQEQDREG